MYVAELCARSDIAADRRPVDPTPIIQLKVKTSEGEDVTPVDPRTHTTHDTKGLMRPGPSANGMLFMQSRLPKVDVY